LLNAPKDVHGCWTCFDMLESRNVGRRALSSVGMPRGN
jgi:hypothetical protein